MQEIPSESVDCILCDLPYGVTDCEWDNIIPFPSLWENYKRIVKPNGAIILFSIQPFTTKLIQSNPKQFRYCWYWKKNNKTGAPFAKVQPLRCIEDICIFYKHKPTYNPQGLKKLDKPIKHKIQKPSVYTFRGKATPQQYTNYPVNLIEFDGVNSKERKHPTEKPVPLLEYLVKTYTNDGETVLDNCMGSGSTGVACMNTGRKFIGIEQDPFYYEIAKNRIKKIKEWLLRKKQQPLF